MRLEQDAPPLSQFRPEVTPELDRLVARMLAREPDRRFSTPADLAAALAPFTKDHESTSFQTRRAVLPKQEAPTNPGTFDTTDPSFDSFLQSIPQEPSRKSVSKHSQPVPSNLHAKWWLPAIGAAVLFAIGCWLFGR
jgi:hypothetical protein